MDSEAMSQKRRLGRPQREVREMLVINGIELAVADQPGKMGKFDGDCAGPRQEKLKTSDEIVQVGDVSQDVIRHDQVSCKIATKTLRRVATEKRDFGRDTFFDGGAADVGGWLD